MIGLLGFFITTMGELFVGYSVLRVHTKLGQEKSIDDKVVNEVHKEQGWTIAGVIFIILGFLIQAINGRFV